MKTAGATYRSRVVAWAGTNVVPLVLVPLALLLIWVALWRIWLPPASSGGTVARSVTTVDANASRRPTHRVTTVVKTARGTSPSRRSEVLVLALVFLGAGAAVVGLFHDRIGSLELGRDGIKLELTPEERTGAGELVALLAEGGAGARAYARGVDRYLRAVAGRRPAGDPGQPPVKGLAAGLTAEQAIALGERIAADVG